MVYDPRKCTEASNQFAQQCLRMEIVANGCDRHQTPPGESFLHSHILIFFVFVFCTSLYKVAVYIFCFLTSFYKALNEFSKSFYFFISIFQISFYSYSFWQPTRMLQWRSRSNKGGSSCSLSCWWSRQPSQCSSNSPNFFYTCHLSFWKEISDLCFSLGKISKGGISQDGHNYKNKQ